MQAAKKAGLPEALCPQVEAWQQRAWQAFSSAQEEERRQLAEEQASSAVQVTSASRVYFMDKWMPS